MVTINLSDQERKTLASMSIYWQEVRRRDDQSPLRGEVDQVYRMLGPSRLLACVEAAIEMQLLMRRDSR